MQWVRRGLMIILLLAVAFVVAIWIAWNPITDLVRQRVTAALAQALHLPVDIGRARVSIRPLQIEIGDVTLGENGTAMRIRNGRLTIDVRESFRRLQPVGDLVAADIHIAPLSFAVPGAPSARPSSARALPLFALRRLRVANATVLIPMKDGTPFSVSAEHIVGRIAAVTGNRLETTIRARALHVTRQTHDVPLRVARGRIVYRPGNLEVPLAVAIGPDVDVRVRRRQADKSHRVDATVDLAVLTLIDARLDQLRGRVAIEASLADPLESQHIDAHVTAPQLEAFGQSVENVDVEARLRGRELEIAKAAVDHPTGSYAGSGTLGLHDALAFALKADWSSRQPESTSADAKTAPPLLATAQANAHGTIVPLIAAVDINGTAARAGEGDRVEIHGTGTYENHRAQAQLAAKQRSGNEVSVAVSMDAAGTLDGAARTAITDVVSWQSLLGMPQTPGMKGVLNVDARIGGTRDQPVADARASGANLVVFGTTLAGVDAQVRADRARIDLTRLAVRFPRGTVNADGTFGIAPSVPNDWRIAISDLPTQDAASLAGAATGTAIPLWGGSLNAAARGGGPWSSATVSGDLHAENFYLGQEPIAGVSIAFRTAGMKWSTDARLVHGPDEWVSATASGNGAASVTASVQSSTWDLHRLHSAAGTGLSGQMTLQGDAQGPPAALNGRVHLSAEGVEWAQRAIGQMNVDAQARAGAWQLQARCGELISATGTFDARGDLPLRASVQWRDADLAPIIKPDPNVRIDSTGTLQLQVPLRAMAKLNGALTLTRFDVASGEESGLLLSLPKPVEIVAHDGRVDLRAVHLGGTGTDITATGWLTTAGHVEVDVNATSNLALVEALSPTVQASRGNATLHLRVRRSEGESQLSGNATLERASLDFGPPWVVVNVNSGLSFDASTIHIDALTGRLEGGTFAVAGDIDVAHGPALTWTATDIAPSVISDLEAELSGHGGVHGNWAEIVADGEIQVNRAVYNRRFALTDLIPLFHEKLAKPKAKEPSATLVRLDLHVVAPDELFVDNNIAKIEMRTDLHLSGPVENVVIAGPVEVLEGEVKFRGRTFTLTTGLIEFRPELGRQAYLNINAQTIIPGSHANYTVETHIVGTTADYRITFSADDPNLSQTDLVSLITFGKTVAELQEGGGGVSINDLIALAPGLYQEQVEEHAQTLLGVDTVELEPGYSKSTGVYEPRVTLGKNLTQDLTASLSSTFGIQRRQRVQLEYKFSPRVSLLGDWESASTDEAGAFGGEIKFRYPFRSFPGWTALLPLPSDDVQ